MRALSACWSGTCTTFSRCGTSSCRANATGEARRSRTHLSLTYDFVHLIALDAVDIPFPIDCPVDFSGAVTLPAVIRIHGGV